MLTHELDLDVIMTSQLDDAYGTWNLKRQTTWRDEKFWSNYAIFTHLLCPGIRQFWKYAAVFHYRIQRKEVRYNL